MKNLKALGLAATMLVAGATTSVAQDKVEATVSADVVSDYVWRGIDCGEASVQPTLGISYAGFSLTAWGSTEISDWGNSKELDLTLAYSIGGFNVGITDYWFSAGQDGYYDEDENWVDNGRYFVYGSHKTNHVFEANVGYDFGPVAFQWYTNFFGNDYQEDGDHAYSSYMELSAPFRLGGLDWNAAIGAVPYESGSCYGYCDGFAVTNVSVKASYDIKITPSFNIPLFGQVVANPHEQKAYFVCGFTLKAW